MKKPARNFAASQKIAVMTTDASTGEREPDREMDIKNTASCDWLLKHLVWALTNNRQVSIIPIYDIANDDQLAELKTKYYK